VAEEWRGRRFVSLKIDGPCPFAGAAAVRIVQLEWRNKLGDLAQLWVTWAIRGRPTKIKTTGIKLWLAEACRGIAPVTSTACVYIRNILQCDNIVFNKLAWY